MQTRSLTVDKQAQNEAIPLVHRQRHMKPLDGNATGIICVDPQIQGLERYKDSTGFAFGEI